MMMIARYYVARQAMSNGGGHGHQVCYILSVHGWEGVLAASPYIVHVNDITSWRYLFYQC